MKKRLPSIAVSMVTESRPLAPPPPQQQPTALGLTSEMEAITVQMPWSRGKETSVYITQRRWRACDVYVQIPAPTGPTYWLSVFVYAVAQGGRTLVASGRIYSQVGEPAFDTEFRKWIVAARSSAERYEVTLRVDQGAASADLAGQVSVTVVGTDEMTEPPPFQGSMRWGVTSSNIRAFNAVGLTAPPRLEVMGVTGINTAAAVRYLMLFDTNVFSAVDLATQRPMGVWSLGSALGTIVVDDSIRFRCASAPVLAVSSDPITYTDPGDGNVGIVVR